MALFRALEMARPAEKRLFADPLAAGFLRPSLKLVLHLAGIPLLGMAIPKFIDHRWPGARTSAIARTRLIDDLMVEALNNGLEQIVILGAGFDARAYRLPHPATARFYEVDQPATSHVKQRSLKKHLGALPSHVVFVAIDFNQQELGPTLERAGFRQQQPAFLLWEGVTNYLTEKAVDSTLRWIGSSAPLSRLVFTYVHKDVIQNPVSFRGAEQLARTLARSNESWTFGLDPAELHEYLGTRGLGLSDDLGAGEYRTRYLGGPGEGYEFYRVAVAKVVGS